MRIFLTGASGYVGSAIADALLAEGHEVLGLARSAATAERMAAAGLSVHRGDLRDPASLAEAAKRVDGVIHTAFEHDFARYREIAAADQVAVETIGEALAASGKPFLAVSVTSLLPSGRLGREEDVPADDDIPRAGSEQALIALAARDVRSVAVRFPPSIHGPGDHGGFVSSLVEIARRTGVSAYVAEGDNRWPAVHRRDVARLFMLALVAAEPGQRLHAVAEEGLPFKTIAQAIGDGIGLPIRSVSPDEAEAQFGWMGRFAMLDNPASSERTRSLLAWRPREPGLIEDMPAAGYFAAACS